MLGVALLLGTILPKILVPLAIHPGMTVIQIEEVLGYGERGLAGEIDGERFMIMHYKKWGVSVCFDNVGSEGKVERIYRWFEPKK